MKKQKIVILKGAPATGKTTALHNLRKHKRMKNWLIIDFNQLKRQFEHLGNKKRKLYGKQSLFSILKIFMPQKINIIFDEISGMSVRKNLRHYIKKYNYEVIVFEFTADIKKSIQREAQRRTAKGMKPRGEKWVRKSHKNRVKLFEPHEIIIDTTNLNEKQVVNFILKNINANPKQ